MGKLSALTTPSQKADAFSPSTSSKLHSSDVQIDWFLWSVFLLAILTLAIRIPLLHIPLDRDEGGFAYIAWNWAQGHLPYVTAFDNKPPVLYAFYRFVLAAFGTQATGIHLAFILLGLANVFCFYRVACRWLNREAALFSALAFSLLSGEWAAGVGNAANAEAFMLLPLLGGIYFLGRKNVLAGLLFGAAIFTKQTGFLSVAAILLALLVRPNAFDLQPPRRWSAAVACLLGTTIVPALTGIYFAAHHALPTFVQAVFTYNLEHVSGVLEAGRLDEALQQLLTNLREMAGAEAVLWILAIMGAAASLRGRRGSLVLCLWSLGAVVSVCTGFRFLTHYFVELAPVLALWAALGASMVARRISRPAAAWVLLSLAVVAPYAWFNRGPLLSGSPEALGQSLYDGNHFAEAAEIGAYLAETTPANARIFVFGSEPEILFLAQRQSATRHIFFYPLTIERAGALAFQQEAAAEYERNAPDVLVWVNDPLSFLAGPKTDTFILDEGRRWVKSGQYGFDGVVLQKAGEKSRVLLGAEAVKDIKPAAVLGAPIIVYRRISGDRP